MKRILFLFLPFLPYLATAQVAKDTVTVLTLAQIPAGAIRDTTNLTFVQDNGFKKATFDSLARYTRVKLQTYTLDSTHIAASGLNLQGTRFTGTLPVTRGGTGAGTFTDNSFILGKVQSPLQSSTQLTQNGTTVEVANSFQVDKTNKTFFVDAVNNRVAIGHDTTNNPFNKLDIRDTNPLNFAVTYTGSQSTGSAAMALQTQANNSFLNGRYVQVAQFAQSNTGTRFGQSAGSIAEITSFGSSRFIVGNISDAPAHIATNNALRLTVLGNGNVGIGTLTPNSLLEVNGISAFANGGAGTPSVTNTGNTDTGMWFPAADAIGFSTSGGERMRVKANGQVRFIPLAAAPGSPELGDVYYDSGTNKLRVYAKVAGTDQWVDLH